MEGIAWLTVTGKDNKAMSVSFSSSVCEPMQTGWRYDGS
jgi:hypothetical protein